MSVCVTGGLAIVRVGKGVPGQAWQMKVTVTPRVLTRKLWMPEDAVRKIDRAAVTMERSCDPLLSG